jgi:hypothetical protein
MVVISGSSQVGNESPVSKMVGLLRELVEGVRDLMKVTPGLAGIGQQMFQQNTTLIRLGERQAYLAEQARGDASSGSGSGTETEKEE